MWVSPNHPNPPRTSSPPPEETGQRLGTFPRGQDEELRVVLDEFKGRPFIGLRVWARGTDGEFWPVKGKGLSVRIRECSQLAEILAGVEELLAEQGGPDHARPSGQSPRQDAPGRRDDRRADQPRGSRGSHGGAPSQARPASTDDDRPRYVDRRRAEHPPWEGEPLPPGRVEGPADFDECQGD